MFEKAYVVKTMAEKLSEDLINKINKLLPPSTPHPETIYKEISQTLNISEYQIRRYIKAMTFLEKIKPS